MERLRTRLREEQLAALLVTQPHNRRYLSGFDGSAGTLLITATAALLFTDFRYRARATAEAPAFVLHEVSNAHPLPQAVADAAAGLGLRQIAFEADHLTVAKHAELAATLEAHEAPTPALEPTENLVCHLRETKDADELVLLRRAIAITDAAFLAVVPQLMPQHTEREVAWMLEVAMREGGAEALAFPIIVAAGSNAANPHATPGDAPLGSGVPILIDMGARYRGYHADMTRTITLGTPDDRFFAIYETVLRAQQHAAAHVRAGMRGEEADTLAREVIEAAGYGEQFGHGLGHGVGLDIHELPRLRPTDEETLRCGSVFSIEPGIYLDGWGGVRIEDLVLLHANGAETLTQTPKAPVFGVHTS